MDPTVLSGRQKRALIVDDEEGVRYFVRAIMEQEGWATEEAEHGDEALDLVERQQPDLIILDLNMPVMDGFEVFERLRQNPLTERIPIIVLTAHNDQEDGVRYSADDLGRAFGVPGPEGFVEKPVDANFLRNCVFGVIG
ncbi:MAG: response regulator [Candidatus Hydrogenedentes bacterium]|nr:response regulator [Candidatus Hydrogenedentota bacterium]